MKLKVFFSWQEETDISRNKNYIRKHLQNAIEMVNKKYSPELNGFELEYAESMRNEVGDKNVPITIFEKQLIESDMFLGDFSIVDPNRGENVRAHFNNNVLLEYQRFKDLHGSTGVVRVMNKELGSALADDKIMPFDIRQIRFPVEYEVDKTDLTKTLSSILYDCSVEVVKELRDKYKPFMTWYEQINHTSFQREFFSCEFLETLQEEIRTAYDDMRILGLSGIGKTRVVVESFRENDEKFFKNSYLYAAYDEDTRASILRMAENIFMDKDNNSLLIVDNCPASFARKLSSIKYENNSSNRIITIYNEPEEPEINKLPTYTYRKIGVEDMAPVVSQILETIYSSIPEDRRKLINEFSAGLPIMAVLMAEKVKSGEIDFASLNDSDLKDKLLPITDGDEYEIMKSLSLFQYVGYQDEAKWQMNFVLSTPELTYLSKDDQIYRDRLFQSLLSRYVSREIFEIRGRLLGVRPRPLALHLAEKWFAVCTSENLLRVIVAIQKEDIRHGSKLLTDSVCKQLRYLSSSPKAKFMVNDLMGIKSPFSNAEVLNTDLGSRLFRSFVEVNPEAVAGCLLHVFGGMNTAELKKIKEGRRNLIWTIEKLAFYKETFEIGAKLLLKFAVAENEHISNNATGQFLELFHIYLPGTEANLEERTKILQWSYSIGEYRPMTIKAVSHALKARDFVRMMGAETQGTKKRQYYQPTIYKEIFDYWRYVLDILKDYAKESPSALDESCKILCDSFSQMLQHNGARVIMPVLEYFCDLRNNDWDELRDVLTHFWVSKKWPAHPDLYKDLVALAERLRKTDFVSRFKEVSHRDFLDFDQHLQNMKRQYAELAHEWVFLENCNPSILGDLYEMNESFTNYFGFAVAEELKANDRLSIQFIDNSMDVIASNPEKSYQIFNGFVSGCTDDVFAYAHNLCKEKAKPQLFPLLAVRNFPIKDVEELFELVQNDEVSPSMFLTFFTLRIWQDNEEDIIAYFEKMIALGGKSIDEALHNVKSLLYFHGDRDHTCLAQLFTDRIIDGTIPFNLDQEHFTSVLRTLLQEYNSPELAKLTNGKLIEYYNQKGNMRYSSYSMEEIYTCLLSKYFEQVWPVLSEKLIDEDYLLSYFSLKNILGSSIGGVGEAALFRANHEKELFEWCEKYPDRAPVILASIIPTTSEDGFSDYVIKLLDRYGDKEEMLSSLSANLGSFAWTGSVIPFYENQKSAFEKLLPHKIPKVDAWIKLHIDSLNKSITYEEKKEAEEKILFRE